MMRDQLQLSFSLCLLVALSILALSAQFTRAPASAPPNAAPPDAALPSHLRHVETGIASWYGRAWQGRRTASGARFDASKLTAAHRSLPLNSRVRVTNLSNGQSVDVTINDRGPYVAHRVIDVSAEAAKRLGMTDQGLAHVKVEMLAPLPGDTEIAQR